jgi:hypothetical protein
MWLRAEEIGVLDHIAQKRGVPLVSIVREAIQKYLLNEADCVFQLSDVNDANQTAYNRVLLGDSWIVVAEDTGVPLRQLMAAVKRWAVLNNKPWPPRAE